MKLSRPSVWLAASLSLLLVCPLTAQGGWVFDPEELRPAEASAQREPDALAARDVTGKWILTVDLGDGGGGEATFELKQDGATRSPEHIPGLSAKPKFVGPKARRDD